MVKMNRTEYLEDSQFFKMVDTKAFFGHGFVNDHHTFMSIESVSMYRSSKVISANHCYQTENSSHCHSSQ